MPIAWKGELEVESHDIHYRIKTNNLHIFNNMVLGGFAMGAVEGEVIVDGKSYDFFGFSELISF